MKLVRNHISHCVGLVLITLFLSACHGGASSSGEPLADQETTLQASAAPVRGKPGPIVKLLGSQPVHLAAAGSHDITLKLQSPHYPGEMSIDITAGKGVELLSAAQLQQIPLTQKGEYSLPLRLHIAQEGRYYIHLNVGLALPDSIEQRAISAILQVGDDPGLRKKSASTEDSSSVIELPAQERVAPH